VRKFDTLDQMFTGVIKDLLEDGHDLPSRDGPTTEILGYVARLNDPRANFMFNPIRKMSPWYAAAELLWYLQGENDITMMKAYAPQYERFVAGTHDDGVHAHGAYGYRWKWHDQVEKVIKTLSEAPESRQAVITCWEPSDLDFIGKVNDIPCTLSLDFKLRDGLLYLTVTMRSNDVWLGLPYDTWCFTMLQHLIAYRLRDKGLCHGLGWYQIQASSMHLYDRNRLKAHQAAKAVFGTGPLEILHQPTPYSKEHIQRCIEFEQWNRERRTYSQASRDYINSSTLWGHLIAMTACKWDPEGVAKHAKYLDPDLKKYMGALACS
jgi:thymidylate synthase